MKPPKPQPKPTVNSHHGLTWMDDFAWLRAENWQACLDNPALLPEEIRAYLESENAWYEANMADTKALQAQLVSEMRGRIQGRDVSLPDEDGGWRYVEQFQENDEFYRYWREPVTINANRESISKAVDRSNLELSSSAQLLIDFNQIAEDYAYFDPGDALYSPSHTHLVWTFDSAGSERYSLRIRDLSTGLDSDFIEDVYDVTWGDNQHIFYTRVDHDQRPSMVLRHQIGTPVEQDVVVYEEPDTRFSCSVWLSLSRQYIFIGSDTGDMSELWFIPVNAITTQPTLVEPRTADLEYSLDHQGDHFFILTNADSAEDFKIMITACETPGRENWQDWLPHQPGRMILDLCVYQQWVMWLERENALPIIAYCSPSGIVERLTFDDEAYALTLEPLVSFTSNAFRFDYESPSKPPASYLFNMNTRERTLLKQEEIPSGHNPQDYRVVRVCAQSSDGVEVPLTLLHHRNTPIDGTAPCWLTAYGAYGDSMPAEFSSAVLSLVDRGFVYTIAHIRGGQEKGRAWYEAARYEGKHRSFDDVIASAEFLINHEYTACGKLILQGASAGGLVVGAVSNRGADYFGGFIADVPFVDALNTLMDASLPLTAGEWSQWGNPTEDISAFKFIQSYSPYDNVCNQPYPPMLVTAGVSDPRVLYWEPAKWVAKHRSIRSDESLLLLKTHMSSGHFGETGRFKGLDDIAVEQAFALKVLGQASVKSYAT